MSDFLGVQGSTQAGGPPSGQQPVGYGNQAQYTINVQDMNALVNASSNAVRALAIIAKTLGNSYIALAGANTFTGVNAFTKPPQLPVSTVAALPAITLANVGSLAFASNGRNTGEGAAAGTGCTVQVQNKSGIATWCAVYSGVAVTA